MQIERKSTKSVDARVGGYLGGLSLTRGSYHPPVDDFYVVHSVCIQHSVCFQPTEGLNHLVWT